MIAILPLAKRSRYCSECADGERRTIATVSMTYRNDEGRLIRGKHVCSDHAEMIAQDHAAECVIISKELLPQTKQEAAEWMSEIHQQPGLREIAEGRRIGIPTLCRDVPDQRAAGILSGKPVEWRNRINGV